jgi:hypothetical protein
MTISFPLLDRLKEQMISFNECTAEDNMLTFSFDMSAGKEEN